MLAAMALLISMPCAMAMPAAVRLVLLTGRAGEEGTERAGLLILHLEP
jgi:hypothetical protein